MKIFANCKLRKALISELGLINKFRSYNFSKLVKFPPKKNYGGKLKAYS